MHCDYCGNNFEPAKVRYYTGGNFDVARDAISMPFICRRCGGSFCADHRLPEGHECPGLLMENKNIFENLMRNEVSDHQDTIIVPHNYSSASEPENQKKSGKPGKIYRYYSWKHPLKKIYYTPFAAFKSIVLNWTAASFLLIAAVYLVFNSPYINSIDLNINMPSIPDFATNLNNDNNTGHYVENYERGIRTYWVGGDGHKIYLQNNPDASDPTYEELVRFIKSDKTDMLIYSDTFVCADYAELVHNNAESSGIRAAFVSVDFVSDDPGHALNAFNTRDKGLVYIDSTGGTKAGPCSYDRLMGIEVGKPMWYYELYKCNDKYYYPPFTSSKVEKVRVFW